MKKSKASKARVLEKALKSDRKTARKNKSQQRALFPS